MSAIPLSEPVGRKLALADASVSVQQRPHIAGGVLSTASLLSCLPCNDCLSELGLLAVAPSDPAGGAFSCCILTFCVCILPVADSLSELSLLAVAPSDPAGGAFSCCILTFCVCISASMIHASPRRC